ncbi:MAG: prephenate dehydratase [Flavobacteriaceae bacterium]|nr:prephenate dehydratase [Flavobacteriaceae bacterium]
MKIAIQGIFGSNHHIVAYAYFGEDNELLCCHSFESVVQKLLNDEADMGVMAIENSLAGSIIPNYALLYNHRLKVIGEYYQEISHHLMALNGQGIEDITEVHSHPMALLQCTNFFKTYPQIKLVEAADTALVAQQIHKNKQSGIAAIAPGLAANLYELETLATDIQNLKTNSTRFLIVTKEQGDLDTENANKASLRFLTEHKRGSLAAILNMMSDCRLNLTKIQSLPVIETPWKYAFFVDVTFEDHSYFQKALALIELMAEDAQVLGVYKNHLKQIQDQA